MGQRKLTTPKQDDLSKRPDTARRKTGNTVLDATTTRRGEALRARRRVGETVNAVATLFDNSSPVNKSVYNGLKGEQWTIAEGKKRAQLSKKKKESHLRVIPVGGTEIGKNTTALEYEDEIVVVDMGFLFPGNDFPGINYIVPDITYLEEKKENIKAVVFTHGHLDHIGAFHHLIPKIPAPVYATKFTIEMLKKNMKESTTDFEPDYNILSTDNHDRVQVGKHFSIELVRVNHSIPDSACVVVRTPVGVVVLSGDWRFDDNPVDGKQFDMKRLTEIATKEGIHLLINESTSCEVDGHNDTSEFDIKMSFGGAMEKFPNSRIIISSFSSQIHRLQCAIQEAAKHGRKVAVAGTSMIANIELALRTGDLKVPAGTLMTLEEIVKLPDSQICILCTGNQGELNAVLNRMASGAHRFIKIKNSDIILLSSSRIPGNEAHIAMMEDNLIREGSEVISKNNTAFYGLGALHAGGHGFRDDHIKFITALNPKFYYPNHGDFTFLVHNAEIAERSCGIPKENIFVCDAGDVVEFYHDGTAMRTERIHVGNIMYDNVGSIVPDAVLKDRIHMSTEGIFVVVLTVQKGTGRMLSNPDIISRGFIYLRDSEELISSIRQYAKQKVSRVYASRRVDMEEFKRSLREEITQILYDQTSRTPIVIPVINEVGSSNSPAARKAQVVNETRDRDFAAQEMARLKGQGSAHFFAKKPLSKQNSVQKRQSIATKPAIKKPAPPKPISFKKTPKDGPNPMQMWRES